MKKINIINIEDSSYDSLLMKLELEESGLNLGKFTRIQTAAELIKIVSLESWDVVICDYYLPCFDVFQALNIIHSKQPGLPFILFSGQANNEAVQKVLRAGASAVINKEHRHILKKTIDQIVLGNNDEKLAKPFQQAKSTIDGLSMQTDSASLGAWEWDIVRDYLVWNEQMFAIYGIEKQQFQHDFHSWQQRIHPDDLAYTERALQYSLSNKKIFSAEFRIIRPDGEIQTIRACGLAQWNNAGIPLRMVGISENITQTRKIEEQLYLNALIVNEDPAGIMITDIDGKILKVNKSFCTVTGYTEAELLGKTPSILHSGKHDKDFYRLMWESVLARRSWQGAIWNRNKNGTVIQQLLSISAIENQNHQTAFYLASYVDLKVVDNNAKKHLLDFDLLTGLPSRYALKHQLNSLMAELHQKEHFAALLYIDLDRFQSINDVMGCSIGDEVLKVTGRRITAELRSTDIACRIGGDEFVVLLKHLDMPAAQLKDGVLKISDNIKKAISKSMTVNQETVNLTCSIGIIIHSGDELTPDNMLSFAKNALHQAKETRDTIHFFSSHMKASLEHTINLEHALHKAINNKELSLHYQAQLRHKRIVSAEALLRWNSKKLGFISPAELIPVAETTGLIHAIGYWVLETVCRHIKSWEQQGLFEQTFSSVAINVSTLQFRHKGYAESVIQTIENAGIQPQHLKLELTESVLINTNGQDTEVFNQLKSFGIKFAIDDFGTGYCSFSYLYKLPLDLLKIDRTFVSNICDNPKELAIIKAIIAMAKTLEIDVIAEGVESSQQAEMLEQVGCDFYQGYLYSRPVPVDQFTKLLTQG